MVDPFLIGSDSAKDFLPVGTKVLRNGGSAIDAVEAAIRVVEANPDDHGVGIGGIPNLLEAVQLDASIMDGGDPRRRGRGGVGGVFPPHLRGP
jgi:beta-aspartyl-peptidase (threonine type)